MTGDRRMMPALFLLFFWRNGQAKYRELTFTSYVDAAGAFGVWQVQCFAGFATIDLRIGSPGLFDAAALLLDSVGGVEPTLQMTAAELAFLVLLVAGALARLLDFDFMVRKLLQSVRDCGFNGCQRDVPLCHMEWRALENGLCEFILLDGRRGDR